MAEVLILPGGQTGRVAPLHSTRSVAVDNAGSVQGGVRMLLRLEGLSVLLAAVAAYAQFGAGWGAGWGNFALLFLVPDVSFAAYLAGLRIGAAAYNAAHSYVGPLLLLAVGVLGALPLLLAASLVWFAHIGFDRMLGYGLKYGSGFGATHLGRVGRRDPW